MDLIISLGHWNWFILAALLLILELVAPGAFMLWLGLAAILVGIITAFVVWPWQAQLIAFAVIAVACIPLWRRFSRARAWSADQPMLNRRAEALIGRTFTLEKPIVGGVGAVRVGDTLWRVAGPDCPAGARVRVAGADGADLKVEVADF